MVQWWEHSPLNILSRVQIPTSTPYVGIGVRAIFCQGGTLNHLPKKIVQFASNFYKTVEQKWGPMQQHRPYWLMKMARYSFSESIPAKFEHKLRRHKQKLPPQLYYVSVKSKLQHPPRAYPGYLTPLLSRGGGNLIIRAFQGVGNLIPMRRGWGIWTVVSISFEISGRFARDKLWWQGRGDEVCDKRRLQTNRLAGKWGKHCCEILEQISYP